MSDDRRADARDRRLGDMDLDTSDTDERPRRKGRASLDEFDFSDLPERRDVVAEWLDRGTRTLPKPKRSRGKDQNPRVPDADPWTGDYPEFPAQIGDWSFRTDYTENEYLKVGYVDQSQGMLGALLDRKPRVVFDDKREFDKGISAHVVTENVFRVPPGAPPGEPIVSADDPETFRRRLVLYLDGEQPDSIRHPYYDPALERDLPEDWTYAGMLPTPTKAKHKWVWDSPRVTGADAAPSWRVFADGYVNGAYDVFAYTPGGTTGYRAPRYHARDWGAIPLPGDGASVAAETARRIMRKIVADPTPPGENPDTPPPPSADVLTFNPSGAGRREFAAGDRVAVTFTNAVSDNPEQVRGTLIGWDFSEDRDGDREITYVVRDDDGTEWTFTGSSVRVNDRTRGYTRRASEGIPRLLARESRDE